jgi:pilus assembly protein CpaF
VRLPEPLIRAVHERLIERLDLRRTAVDGMADGELRKLALRHLERIVAEHALPPDVERDTLVRLLLQEVVGLGPLEDLLADDSVSEIMVNGADVVFVERGGRLVHTTLQFSSERALLGVIERLLQPTGRRVDESSPMVDARLPDGSRINVVVPPLAIRGPAVTVRKFARRRIGIAELVRGGSLSPAMAEFLDLAVRERRNIVVSGGTGAGKTTLLNALSDLIPADERIVTIEDSAELQLLHPNLVVLEARPRNLEGRGQVTIRELVRNALRMRPDRIVVGECRGGEALDMLQAMNTGHSGSLTTAHANSPRDLLLRLEVMVLMSGMELPLSAVREQVASAVNLIVQQARFPCGRRRIVRIAEVTGTESGRIQLQDLFRFETTGTDDTGATAGRFIACGNVPVFLDAASPERRRREAERFAAGRQA